MKGTARKLKPLIVQTLKDSELQYRRLFEAAQDGILLLDAKTGAITDVNPFLINMLGYSPGSLGAVKASCVCWPGMTNFVACKTFGEAGT